jgi:hypothetical protein
VSIKSGVANAILNNYFPSVQSYVHRPEDYVVNGFVDINTHQWVHLLPEVSIPEVQYPDGPVGFLLGSHPVMRTGSCTRRLGLLQDSSVAQTKKHEAQTRWSRMVQSLDIPDDSELVGSWYFPIRFIPPYKTNASQGG